MMALPIESCFGLFILTRFASDLLHPRIDKLYGQEVAAAPAKALEIDWVRGIREFAPLPTANANAFAHPMTLLEELQARILAKSGSSIPAPPSPNTALVSPMTEAILPTRQDVAPAPSDAVPELSRLQDIPE